MIKLDELHIKKVLEENPASGKYEWIQKVKIAISDETKIFSVTLPNDTVKRILSPIIDVIVDALDTEKEKLKNDLLAAIQGEEVCDAE